MVTLLVRVVQVDNVQSCAFILLTTSAKHFSALFQEPETLIPYTDSHTFLAYHHCFMLDERLKPQVYLCLSSAIVHRVAKVHTNRALAQVNKFLITANVDNIRTAVWHVRVLGVL